MYYLTFKVKNAIKYFQTLLLFAMGAFFGSAAFALTCPDTLSDVPTLVEALCPVVRVVNVLIWVVGAVFLIMIVYGAIKMAMSLGEPKLFAGATGTLTHAVIGLLVVAGFFAIFLIITNIIGISPFSTPFSIIEKIEQAITRLLLDTCNQNPNVPQCQPLP